MKNNDPIVMIANIVILIFYYGFLLIAMYALLTGCNEPKIIPAVDAIDDHTW